MWFYPLGPWNVLQSALNIHYKVTISDHTKKEHYQLQNAIFSKIILVVSMKIMSYYKMLTQTTATNYISLTIFFCKILGN